MSAMGAVKRSVLRHTPQWIRNAMFGRREARRLSALPPASVDAQALGHASDKVLEQAMSDAGVAAARDSALKRIDALNIVAFAGGVNLGDRRALFSLVAALKPGAVLEVGTHIGASTASISTALASVRPEPGPVSDLVTVDIVDVNDPNSRPWEANGSPYSPSEILSRLGVRDRVDFMAQPSLEFLHETDRRFDLIFLDGDHSAATVYREVPAALRCLNPGGLILLHDYYPDGAPLWSNGAIVHGPWMAIERLVAEGAPLRVVPFGELPWETKLGSRRSSLALLCHS